MQSELKEKLGLTEQDFFTHESDLYVVARPEVVSYLKANYKYWSNCTYFKCQVTGRQMIDIPFANENFWNKVADKVAKRAEQGASK